MSIHLGVNIDHIATLRNARGEKDPSLVEVALEVQRGGADSITMHLREDRRHIIDEDLFDIRKHLKLPINFEMALTSEMLNIALDLKPSSVCLVPERREEVTTEGGLDVQKNYHKIKEFCSELLRYNIQPFLFIDPKEEFCSLAKETGALGVEIHTGTLARYFTNRVLFYNELNKVQNVASYCLSQNLLFHAGHGLNYHNVPYIIGIPNLKEVNIGHAIIAKSLTVGMYQAVATMKDLLK